MGRIADRSDAELLEASRAGDRDAFGAIVARYQRMVMAVSLDEDVAQDTFVTAWRRLGTLREADKLPGWLCGIARNLGRSSARRRGREVALDDDVRADAAASAFDAIATREESGAVSEALARMPETYREPLVMYYGDDRSVREVAAALGISEEAAMQRLSRGRSRLSRDLVAAVAAAIALVGFGPRVEAATRNAGEKSMWKLGIVAALAAATAGTGIVVARSGGNDGLRSSVFGLRPEAGGTAPAPGDPGSTAAGHRTGATSGRRPKTEDRRPNPSLTCADAAARYAELALESEDPTTFDDFQREQFLDGASTRVEAQCLDQSWSEPHIACVVGAGNLFEAGAPCGDIDASSGHTGPRMEESIKSGATIVTRRLAPLPPAPLTDLGCNVVARRVATLMTPDEAAYEQMPPEQRDSVRDGIARMMVTMPDQIEATCTSAKWPESVRKCILLATTDDAMGTCTQNVKLF